MSLEEANMILNVKKEESMEVIQRVSQGSQPIFQLDLLASDCVEPR